jgi:hypothetical protein
MLLKLPPEECRSAARKLLADALAGSGSALQLAIVRCNREVIDASIASLDVHP